MNPTIIIIAVVVVLAVAMLMTCYLKVKPNAAYIITGPSKSRIVIGKATFRIPVIERVDFLSLDLIQVDIKTQSAVPTNEFINIFVDGVANIKINSDDPNKVRRAAEIFLSRDHDAIKQIAREVLEGNMREIIGQMKLKELVQNRDKFAEMVRISAGQDMDKMGLEIVNITIQDFSDNNNVIQDLGVDNISQIRKDASIAKANSEKEVKIATSQAAEIANQARVEAELKMEAQNTDLAMKKADLKEKSDIARARADAAYAIKEAEQDKLVKVAKQEAEIANRSKEAELLSKQVEVQEMSLSASVKKTAEADRYAEEQKADADLYKRTKLAEATLKEEELKAQALKVKAESERYQAEQKAAGIYAIGAAEAEAIDKKAEAMKKMDKAAILQLLLDSHMIPDMIAAAASPLAKTDKIVMYGDGNSTKLISDIMKSSSQVLEGLKESTGIDIASLLAGVGAAKLIDNIVPESKE